jgi:hypothetical protein
MDKEKFLSDEEINQRWTPLNEISQMTMGLLGSNFTDTPHGHIQTDIAASSSLAGLILLQETVENLEESIQAMGPGNVLLSEVHEGQSLVFDFMAIFASSNGLDPNTGWGEEIPKEDQPLLSCEEMTNQLATPFYSFCAEVNLDRDYWKIAAGMIAMKIVLVGMNTGLLDPEIGKAIAGYYVVAGSKTIPYPEALW